MNSRFLAKRILCIFITFAFLNDFYVRGSKIVYKSKNEITETNYALIFILQSYILIL